MAEERRIQLAVEVDATQTRTGFDEVRREAGSMATSVERSGERASRAIDGIGEAAVVSSRQMGTAERNMVGSIQRATAALEAGSRSGSRYFEVLAGQRGVDRNVLEPYLVQLRAVEAAQTRSTAAVAASRPALDGVGISAAQTAAALRGVPAQFTDIVTSLQGGQQPLTVFLQQGGQLRDTFGGAGAAARGMAGYIASLVNPFTTAAAAAVLLGVAYNQGSKEADAYNRSIVMTGNAVGTTSERLADMARNVSRAVGTQGEAAAVVAELADTGKVGADNLQRFSKVALDVEKTVGRSVGEMARDLSLLADAPLEASKKLNEQYHYLTSAVYDQIRALQEQGRTEEAAAVAQTAYTDAFEERSKMIESRLGVIEKSWRAVKSAASSTWDAIIGVGREDTVGQKLERASNVLSMKQSGLAERVAQGKGDDRISQQLRQDIAAAQAYKNELESQADAANRLVTIETGRQALDKAAIDWKEQGLKLLTKEQKLEQEIAETRRKGLAAGVSDKEIEDRVAAIRRSAAGAVSGKPSDGIDARIEAVKRLAAVEEKVAQRSRDLLESNRAAGLVAEEQYIQAVEALDIGAFEREKARLHEELRLAAGKPNSLKEQAALRGQIAAVEADIISRRMQGENQLYQLEVRRNRTAAENYANALEKQASYRDSITGQVRAQEEANEQIGLSSTALAELTATRLDDQAAIKDQNADIADGLDLTGAMSAEYRAQAEALRELARLKREGAQKDVATQAARDAEAAWKRTAEQIEEALTDSLMRGFESGKSFAENLRDTTINMFKTMVLRPTIQAVVTGNFSGAATGAAGGLGNATSLLSAGQTIWNGFSAGLNGSIGNIVSSTGNLVGSQWLSSVGAGISGGASTAGAASAYAQVGNTAVSSGLTAGASIATYVPVVAAAVASYFGAKAISNGYKVEGIGNLLNFAGLAGGVINRAFGRRGKETTGQGISGMFGVDSLENGKEYTEWIKKGGWFRSDKKGVDTPDLSPEKLAGLNTAYKAIKDSTAAFATALGVPTNVVTSYTKQIKLALTGDDAKDQSLLAEMFAGIGDELASRVVPGLQSFVKEGETASTTLQRLTGEFKTVDAVLDTLGVTSQEAFGSVGVASLAARDRLVQMAGGVDALTSQSTFFAQNFLTRAEQLAPVQKAVTEQMTALGYASVTTNEQFKVAVQGLAQSGALATEAGAKAYAGLLAVAPAFKAVADAAAEASKASTEAAAQAAKQRADMDGQIYDLTHTAAEATARKRQEELAAMDASLRPMQERIYALQDERAAAEAAATAAAEVARQRAGLDGQIYDLTHTSAEATARARQLELAALDASLRPLQERVYALQDEKAAAEAAATAIDNSKSALQANASAAYDVLARSFGAQKDLVSKAHEVAVAALRDQVEAINTAMSKTKSLSDALHSVLNGAAVDDPAQARRSAQAELSAALAIARAGGVLPDADRMARVLSALSEDSADQYGSYEDYQRDLYRTKAEIAELAGLTDDQLTTEEKQLTTLQDQVKVEQQRYQEEIGRLDGILDTSKAQLDQLTGANANILSQTAALASFAAAVAALKGGVSTAAPGETNMTVADLYRSALGREGDTQGLAFWTKAYGASVDPAEMADFLKAAKPELEAKANGTWQQWLKAHGVRGFAVGTNYVPTDMPAVIHEGERIIPAADNRELMRALSRPAQQGDTALLEEIRALREEVRQLKASSIRNEGNTGKATDLLDKVSAGGSAFAVEVMNQ